MLTPDLDPDADDLENKGHCAQHFECQVMGYPTPSIRWFKDDVEITKNERYNIGFDENSGIVTLAIKNLMPADEGCYMCRAENSEGYATTTAYLVVTVDENDRYMGEYSQMTYEKVSEEELSHMEVLRTGNQTVIEEVITRVEETEKEVIEEKNVPPRIDYGEDLEDLITLKHGTNLLIEVEISGNPRPKVTWFHCDKLLTESARVTTETGDGWSYVKVKGVKGEDAGMYKVTAENAAGFDKANFKVLVKCPPKPPQNLRVVEVYKDYVTVAWDEPESDGGDRLLGYQVEKCKAGANYVDAGYVDIYADRQLRVTKLYEGNDYYFRVMAENKVGLSEPGSLGPVTAKLPYDAPGAPSNLQVNEVYKDYITISWEPPTTDGGSKVTQYIIEKRDMTRVGSQWTVAGTTDVDVTNYKVTKLFQGNHYNLRVFAENRVGPGQPIELPMTVEAKLPFDKPHPPRNLRATEVDRDFITVAWDAPESDGGAEITGYVLEKRDVKRPGYIFVAEVKPSDTMSYKVSRLFEGYEYLFRVIAENQVGTSEPCELEAPVKAKAPYDEPGSPRDLRVTEYWTDYISVAWQPPESDGGAPITGYIIEKRDAERNNWIKAGTVGPDVTSFKAENLFEGAAYYFRVYAENKAGPSTMPAELTQPCRAKMPFDPPFQPRNIKTLEYSTDFITISWEDPEHDGGSPITGYVIEKRDASSPLWTQVKAVDRDTHKLIIDKLFEGQSYHFRVTAENQCGRGKALETEQPTTAKLPFDKPSAPKSLQVTDVWKDYMMLQWEPPESDGGSPITGYTVEQRDAYEVGFRFVVSLKEDATGFQVTNLQEGHDYFFRVFAQNAAGLSVHPAEIKPAVTAKLPFEKPFAPEAIQVTSTDKGTISVSWKPPVDDGGSPITGYILETCRTSSTAWMDSAKLDGSTLSHDITGLIESAQYYVRVFAENQAGISKKGAELDEPVFARKPIKPPGTPTDLRALNIERDSVTLTWSPPLEDGGAEVTSYLVEMKGEKDDDYYTLGKVDNILPKYTALGLRSGEKYFFRVRAKNSEGFSNVGAEFDEPIVTKESIKKPGAPGSLSVCEVTTNSVTLSWEAPELDGGAPIQHYVIEKREGHEGFGFAKTVDGDTLSAEIKGLRKGCNYQFRVTAENVKGQSEPMVMEDRVTPKVIVAPQAPQGLQLTDVTSDTITVSWQPPESDGGAKVETYIIVMREASKKKFKKVGKVDGKTLTFTVNSDLSENTEYALRVYAENCEGVSEDAAEMDSLVKLLSKPTEETKVSKKVKGKGEAQITEETAVSQRVEGTQEEVTTEDVTVTGEVKVKVDQEAADVKEKAKGKITLKKSKKGKKELVEEEESEDEDELFEDATEEVEEQMDEVKFTKEESKPKDKKEKKAKNDVEDAARAEVEIESEKTSEEVKVGKKVKGKKAEVTDDEVAVKGSFKGKKDNEEVTEEVKVNGEVKMVDEQKATEVEEEAKGDIKFKKTKPKKAKEEKPKKDNKAKKKKVPTATLR